MLSLVDRVYLSKMWMKTIVSEDKHIGQSFFHTKIPMKIVRNKQRKKHWRMRNAENERGKQRNKVQRGRERKKIDTKPYAI